MNYAADSLARNGFAETITKDEALRIIEECKQAGLAQTGDNVRHKVTYICNCCGCCCEMMQGIRKFEIRGAIVTSNWVVAIDPARCKGCGQCAKACPISAIDLVVMDREGTPDKNHTPKKRAVRDETLCLGCGVCHGACKFGAIVMKARDQRVFTPETVFDRIVTMAVERGKLADLVFDNPQRLSHRALARIVGILEKSPLWKVPMAVKPLRSAFLNRIAAEAKRKSGDLRNLFE